MSNSYKEISETIFGAYTSAELIQKRIAHLQDKLEHMPREAKELSEVSYAVVVGAMDQAACEVSKAVEHLLAIQKKAIEVSFEKAREEGREYL